MSISGVGNFKGPSYLQRDTGVKRAATGPVDAPKSVQPQAEESVKALPSGFRLTSPDLNFEIPSDGQAVLGRKPDSDYPVQDRLVSGTHAVFQMREGKIQILDPGSTNGTIVNGKKLKQKEWTDLEPGSVLRMGTIQLTLRGPNDKPIAPAVKELSQQGTKSATQVAQGALPGLSGLALKDLKSGRLIPIREGKASVGRANDNDVILQDLQVSRQHATLFMEDGAVSIRDNASSNGTKINGESLEAQKWSRLKTGDKLKIGTLDLQLVSKPKLETKADLEKVVDFRELLTDPKKQEEKYGSVVPDEPNNYWRNNVEARVVFEEFLDGDKVGDPKAFKSMLKKSHRFAVEGSSGESRYYKKSGVLQGEAQLPGGKFHEGVMGGRRDEEGALVEEIAKKYDDPYRLDAGDALQPINLEGIQDQHRPNNMTMFGGQRHAYPPPTSFDDYFGQMQDRLKKLDKLPADAKEQKLETIGEFYHYAANVRPFHNVNNSLFMNMTNSLLKRHGMKPVYHGLLDHAAHRLQPKAFNQYFKDWAQGEGQIK